MSPDPIHDENLDEDLFDFDEIVGADSALEDEPDLDDIFASFGDDDDDDLDEEIGVAEEPPPMPAAKEHSEPASAPVEPAPVAASADVDVAGWAEEEPEPAPAAAPAAAAPAPTFTVQSAGLGKSFLLVLVAMTLMNALVAMVVLKSAGDMRSDVFEVGRSVNDTAQEILEHSSDQSLALHEATKPIVSPNPLDHPAFEMAIGEIERGEYAAARQRLYALLSVVDRLDQDDREAVERRAVYMIGQTVHLDAVRREDIDR